MVSYDPTQHSISSQTVDNVVNSDDIRKLLKTSQPFFLNFGQQTDHLL